MKNKGYAIQSYFFQYLEREFLSPSFIIPPNICNVIEMSKGMFEGVTHYLSD